MMTFRTQRSPRRAGSRPDDAEARPDDGVLLVMVTASCPDPPWIVFRVRFEGFTPLSPLTRECSVSGIHLALGRLVLEGPAKGARGTVPVVAEAADAAAQLPVCGNTGPLSNGCAGAGPAGRRRVASQSVRSRGRRLRGREIFASVEGCF